MSKRGDLVAPPPRQGEWQIRHGRDSCAEWDEICSSKPGPTRDAWDVLSKDPRSGLPRKDQHQMKGDLAHHEWEGVRLEQWQIELPCGIRVRYVINDQKRSVLLVRVFTCHPKY